MDDEDDNIYYSYQNQREFFESRQENLHTNARGFIVNDYGDNYGSDDIITMALNLKTKTIEYYKNNILQGIASKKYYQE